MLGGVLTQYLGWRWVLLVNPPVIAVLIPLMLLVLPNEPGRARGERLDLPGAVCGAASISALILGVTEGQQHGFGSVYSTAALAAFVILAVAFVVIERHTIQPMLPGGLLRDPVRRGALAAIFVVGAVLAAYVYFMTLYLQRVLGYSAVITGLSLAPATVTALIMSTQVARRLIPTLGTRPLQFAALLFLGAGQLWLSRIPADGSYVTDVLPGILLSASGVGLALPVTSFAVTHGSLVSGYRLALLVAAISILATVILLALTRSRRPAPSESELSIAQASESRVGESSPASDGVADRRPHQ